MLGHILRSNGNTPTFLSLEFALSNDLTGRRGRHQSNLLSNVLKDLSERIFYLKTLSDLEALRELALDRMNWRSCFSNGDLLITPA